MKVWTYLRHQFVINNSGLSSALADEMSNLGSKGWEIFQVHEDYEFGKTRVVIYAKRSASPEEVF